MTGTFWQREKQVVPPSLAFRAPNYRAGVGVEPKSFLHLENSRNRWTETTARLFASVHFLVRY
jgi:hypothetical protein